MAALYANKSGNWSDTTVWYTGTPFTGSATGAIPTTADDVTIPATASGHTNGGVAFTVTIDTAAVCKSLTMQATAASTYLGGILNNATGANISLILQGALTNNTAVAAVSTRNPRISFDMSADPTHTMTLSLNASSNATAAILNSSSSLNLKGATKTRWSTSTAALTGGTTSSVNIADASGWIVGDVLVFSTTQAYPAIQQVTGSGITWSGGYLSITGTFSSLEKGDCVYLQNAQASLSNNHYTVYDIPSGTSIRIAMSDPTVTTTTCTASVMPRTDLVTISAITAIGGGTYSGTGAATVTWTNGNGASGTIAHDHANGCIVGNTSSNLILAPVKATDGYVTSLSNLYGTSDVMNDVLFTNMGHGAAYNTGTNFFYTGGLTGWTSYSRNIYYNNSNGDVSFGGLAAFPNTTISDSIHYNEVGGGGMSAVAGGIAYGATDSRRVFFKGVNGIHLAGPSLAVDGAKISGMVQYYPYDNASAMMAISAPNTLGLTITNSDFWSNDYVVGSGGIPVTPLTFFNCTIGTLFSGAVNKQVLRWDSELGVTLDSCSLDVTGETLNAGTITNYSNNAYLQILNKNNNTSVQELYTKQSATVPAVQREYATSPQVFTRATSSMLFTSNSTAQNTQTQNILAENGIAVTVIGYLMTNLAYGSSTLPYIKLDGLQSTPSIDTFVSTSTGSATIASTASHTFTRGAGSFLTDGFAIGDSVYVEGFASNNGTFTVTNVATGTLTVLETTTLETAAATRRITKWYKASVTGTQTTGADGNLTLSLVSQSSVANAKAWFSGIPFSPFVSRARHYGYLYDETVPTRTTNGTISASEVTAQGYTGMAVAWGSPSPVTISADNTFQKLYDYSQAYACLNVASALPLTGSGAAGSPSLFAAANVTVNTAKKLNGSGSLSMGSNTLTTEFAGAIAYTYTGGTWSQASATPTFTGASGVVTMATAATLPAFSMNGGTLKMTATSTAWDFSAGSFTGTINLRTDTGTRAVTVLVPAGTTVDTTGESSITVNYTTVNQGIAFTGVVSGSQVKIFTTTTTTELYSATAPTYTFSQAYAGDITVDYTVMKVGYVPLRVTGVLLQQTVQTTPIQQVADREYVASSGLTFTTNATANTSTSIFSINAATTLQNWYSFMIESWIAQTTLKNKAFPLSSNGPSSYTLGLGWEWRGWATSQTQGTGIANTSLALLSLGGMRYVSSGGTVGAIWSGLLTLGTAAGLQVKYRQTTAGTIYSANNTGPMSQIVQVYGNASYGNFDYTGHLVLKIEKVGYTQAKTDVVATYGTLADQFYVAALAPTLMYASTNSDLDATHLVLDNTAKTYVISAAHTMADLYQRAQWWANQDAQWDSDVPLTTLDGSTYTQNSAWAMSGLSYLTGGGTIAGGAVSWLSTGTLSPSINGATMTLGAEGTYTFNMTGNSTVHVAPSAGSKTYIFSSGTFSGTLTVNNDTAYAVTVQVPTGTTTSYTGNTGGTITFTNPPVTATITITGPTAGSRIQLYDTTNSVQLYNGTPSFPYTYPETYASDKAIRLRVSYATASTANEFVDANIGSITSTALNLAYLVAPAVDPTYVTNAVDGSGVTGIAIVVGPSRVTINLAGGTVAWKSIYAYQVYWQFTATGIAQETAFINAVDTANYLLTTFKIKNTSATPLTITGGWGRDSTTLKVADCIDSAGSTGNIYPEPDHVVPIIVTVSGSDVITGNITDVDAHVQSAMTAQGYTTTRAPYIDVIPNLQ